MVQFQVVEVGRNGEGYLIENYLFRKDRNRGDKMYLKCLENHRQFCKARAVIEFDEATISHGDHNHGVPDITEYRFKASLKRAVKSIQNSRLSTPKIFENIRNELLAEAEDVVQRGNLEATLPTYRSVRGAMENARSAMLPPNPDHRNGIDFGVFQQQMLNPDGSNFVLADSGINDPNRILIFGNTRNLTFLAHCTEWYIDGTFWSVPYLFSQVFSIHGFILDQQFPLVYALLPDKTQNTYQRMFQMIMQQLTDRQLYPNGFALQKIVSDFEMGIIATVQLGALMAKKRSSEAKNKKTASVLNATG